MLKNIELSNRFPFNTLLDTSQSKALYIAKAVAISVIPAMCIATLLFFLLPDAEQPELPTNTFELFFSVVLFAPFVETLLMWLGIVIIGKLTSSMWSIALISAFLWALLHSASAPTWGIVIFWSFVVFSLVFISWRRESRTLAYGMATSVHMGQNFLVLALSWLGS